MIQLTTYGERVMDRISMMGMWLVVVVSVYNYFISYGQYRRTRGKIHLVNTAQVVVLFIHRFLYGIIPLFEISTCAYFPFLVSLWHITYLLFYIVMFMRLIILESDRHSLWIKIVGVVLIGIRFADWPYELAFRPLQQDIATQELEQGGTCWAQWGAGVIILNFVADSLANLFLSGMFVRRLYIHIQFSKTVITRQNKLIEHIARKSLVCLILTFVVNLAMNLLKVTNFIGARSDALTAYFELFESTLLVQALRVDHTHQSAQNICENCGVGFRLVQSSNGSKDQTKRKRSFLSRHANKGNNSNVNNNNNDEKRISGSSILPQHLETEDSILRTISFFETSSQPNHSLGADEMVQQQQYDGDAAVGPVFDLNNRPVINNSRTPIINAASGGRPMATAGDVGNVSTIITTTNMVQAPPRAHSPATNRPPLLQQHPEWSNNDYRMF